MSFSSGSVSFRRFLVIGKHPKEIKQDALDRLEEFTLQAAETGLREEVEYGWCGGRHVFDARFTFEHNVFADALHFAMRIDTNRVPGEIKKAYQIMEEEAAAANNPSGHISKQQKRDVKDVVRRKVDEDMKAGKFRRSKLTPMLWDFPTQTLYTSASSSVAEKLHELFERSFDLKLEPLTAGSVALRYLEGRSKRREYEDARPTRFTSGPEGEGQMPEYPWVAKGPQPKDFLGNEFLLWLWHETDRHGGTVKTEEAGEVALVIDQSLELDCAFGQSGKDSLRASGPTQMPEARDALRSGKVPRRVGLIIETAGKQFQLGFNGEALSCSTVKFPEIEDADDARVLFEERIAMLRDLCKGLDALYHTFLKTRASAAWEGTVAGIHAWISKAAKHAAA